MKDVKVPLSLKYHSIKSCVLEMRFKLKDPNSKHTMLGLLFNKIQDRFPTFEPTSINPLFSANEQQFDHIPAFRSTHKKDSNAYILQLGAGVINITSDGYSGWSDFYEEANYIFNHFFSLNLTTEITRIGLRYVNFFSENIIPHLTIEMKSHHLSFDNQNTELSTSFIHNSFNNNIKISNNINLRVDEKHFVGSLIDVDTISNDEVTTKNFFEKVIKMHDTEKKVFFSLLKHDFIETLEPDWGINNA
ncbi:MAG: hypothetical protein COB02_18220 [Candidatus Cloacimonadota bacterium]|nr:MAG: hypothetical protein COB02_18220 [Candidatus Cloacimonadota bacterium]